jgi:hypothetical protein
MRQCKPNKKKMYSDIFFNPFYVNELLHDKIQNVKIYIMSDDGVDITYITIGNVDTMDDSDFDCPNMLNCSHTHDIPINGNGITKADFSCSCRYQFDGGNFSFVCRNCENFHTTLPDY